jgi:hypothetical protein
MDYQFCSWYLPTLDECALDLGGLVVNTYVPGSGFSEIIVDASASERPKPLM